MRILTTHVGSLVRPPELVAYLRAIEDGAAFDTAAWEVQLRVSVEEVVRRQVETGIDIVSDGEFGKGVNWAFYVHRRLDGILRRDLTPEEQQDPTLSPFGGPDREAFADFYADYDKVGFSMRRRTRVVCHAALAYTGQAQVQRDIDNLQSAVRKAGAAGAFLPVVAPASALPNVKDEYYRDEDAFLSALADALRVEYRAIIDAGLDLQVDDAFLTTQYERMVPPLTVDQYRDWARRRIEALNHALAGIPESRTRYHICWGSWNGPHLFDVPLETVVDLVLGVRVGAYLFEAASPRHAHEWRVWETVALPEGRRLVPGVVSHATNIVEHPELVAERLIRFAGIVGRDNVMAGTDCGFAQSPFVQRVHPSIQWAKLRAVVEGAQIASRQLWG